MAQPHNRQFTLIHLATILAIILVPTIAPAQRYVTITPQLEIKHTLPTNDQTFAKTPTLAYTAIPTFNPTILSGSTTNIRDLVVNIGYSEIENLINTFGIDNEIASFGKFATVYHAQSREFLLFYDLFGALYEHAHKTKLNNFVFLRIPTKEFNTWTTISEFLVAHPVDQDYDHSPDISRHLLSVNPSILGNSYQSLNKLNSECTFKYFLRSTNNIQKIHGILIKEVFDFFNISTLFHTYHIEILDLIQLLASQEKEKTGLLLQINIPLTLVDTISYRCIRAGIPFYNIPGIKSNIPLATTPVVPTSQLLTTYPQRVMRALNNTTTTDATIHTEFDELQFRLLLSNNTILNPTSGVCIRHYTKQTENVKQYRSKFNDLIQKITQSLAAQ